jgi:ectoine hydroxylase-related dioxygenase (phytanoyl-CoA dioxygenase family)
MSSGTSTIFSASEVNAEIIASQINESGSIIVSGVLDPSFIQLMRTELEQAISKEVEYHKTVNYKDYGMVMLCAIYGGAFISLFDNDHLLLPFNTILGEGCITYAYTSSSMPPSASNFSNRIHVDSPRLIPGYTTNMGATILLNDFTEENGATWYLPRSQKSIDAPDEDYFYENAKRVIAPAGSVWFFNARVWHAGGVNKTDLWRHAVTLNMCRSYMKQRIDIPRAISQASFTNTITEKAKQKLGFFAQVPASLDEYYLPPDQRKFRQKAE